MVNEDIKKVRRYIDEFQYVTGRYGPLAKDNLPDMAVSTPTITMPKEMVVRFRNNYLLLIQWAAFMCGVEIEKLCPFDLLAPFLRDAMEKDGEVRS